MAQPPPHSTISSLLDSYIATFNTSDLPAASSYYTFPLALISSTSGTTVLHSPADLIATFTSTLTRLKADGWTTSEYVGAKSIAVLVEDDAGARLVVASCPCRRLRGDGSVVEEFTAVYTLRWVGEGEADEGRWGICALLNADFGRVLRG